ncbi:ATP-grasp domain-containing protein [Vibrio lentus]|uniref:ATP-grasp domain-containing protein n=1 Tax=Vibrio lentus TaxID=136468 RepID=UPI000C858693|nr:ATP-grasp domain-containing protein [Vibrio lentus]PMJ04515.1 hypothetical protein BCU32_03150 [Vibrio lentus]
MNSKNFFLLVETQPTQFGVEFIYEVVENSDLDLFILTEDKSWFNIISDLNILDRITVKYVNWSNGIFLELVNATSEIRDNIRGVFTFRDRFQEPLSKFSFDYGFKYTDYRAVELLRDKLKFRNFLDSKSISSLPNKKVKNKNDILDFLNVAPFPIIIKPISGTGSKNAYIIKNHDDIDEVLQKISFIDNYMVEQYCLGQVFSVEGFYIDNQIHVLGVTDRIISPPPLCLELGHSFIPYSEAEEHAKITKLTETILDELGYSHGFFHAEFVVNDEGIYPIEVNPRLAGSSIPIMINKTFSNTNLQKMIIDIQSGIIDKDKDKDIKIGELRYSTFKIYPDRTGVVKSLSGLDFASKFPGVVSATTNFNEGDFVSSLDDCMGFISLIISEGKSNHQAMSSSINASNHISFEIK